VSTADKQAVGETFSADAMEYARVMTWKAAGQIAASIGPGMRKPGANARAKSILQASGMERL